MVFADRVDAGRKLARKLMHLRDEPVVVLGLPRGGVPVAFEVATALGAPLDVIVVRKLGVPFQPELGMGAIGEDGARVINDEIVRLAGVSERQLAEVESRERAELERRALRFRGDRPRVSLAGRTAVLVDDGIATGSTARAACQVARAHGAARVVLAVPVAPPGWTTRFSGDADEFVCLDTPEPFFAIGQFYADFSQTSDEEVMTCLQRASEGAAVMTPGSDTAGGDPHSRDEEVVAHAGPIRLGGHLTVPDGATGVVVFAHGSGSSRHSPRNRDVATVLNRAGLGTLLFDLLTPEEAGSRHNTFDISLLTQRLILATAWTREIPQLRQLPLGYFGASTGAAAALCAAASLGPSVGAVVSRGGRPDLAESCLPGVEAPTLLIVGGNDWNVLELNDEAATLLGGPHELAIVPGAGHLFEEEGALEEVSRLAGDWFTRHLGTDAHAPAAAATRG